jgi:hypothetical protein
MINVDILIWAGTTLIGVIGGAVGAKKLPVRRNGKQSGCPDPECHNEVMNTSKAVGELKDSFSKFKDDVYPKINDTATAVSEISGYLKGLQDGKGASGLSSKS